MAKQPFENVVLHLFQIAAQAEFKTLNDQELLKRYVELKDQLAFGELVRRYKLMIWCVCWHVLRQHQDVEDAFQATIMTLLRRAKTILGRATVEGWLHKTAFKVASNARVVRERRHAREERSAKMRKESFESDNYKWELGELIDKELIRIPEKFRSPLILCYLKGLTQKQAAEQLGISLDNLEWRLHEGRKRLQKNLLKHGLELGNTMPMAELGLGVHVPEMSSGVVEKTLEMVRIMTLSNGALETAGISPQVAALVKGAMGVWTLKVKICLGVLLLTLAGVGVGVARYPGFCLSLIGWEQPQERKPDPSNKAMREPQASKTPPRLDLYGDILPPGALARLGTVRFRNESSLRFRNRPKVGEIVFTPDSRAVGVVEIGKVPRLWNRKTGEPVRQFGDGLRGGYKAGSWLSLDGRRMAYKQLEGRIYKYHVREVATGKLIRTFEVGDIQKVTRGERVCCCALSPDGKTLVGYFNGKLCLMDIATSQQIWEQRMDMKDINNVCRLQVFLSPDGAHVAVECNRDKKSSIELRDAGTGKWLRTLGHPWVFAGYNDSFSFSPDGRSLIVAYGRGSAHLWDVDKGTERWHLDHENHIYSRPAFSPDGKIVAFHDCLKCGIPEIALHEVATGKKVGFCYYPDGSPEGVEHNTDGNLLTFSPDSKVLVSMPGDCPLITCWDVATSKVLTLPPFGHEAAVQSVSFAPDGKTLLSKGKNQAVHVWDSFTGRKERTLIEESSLRSAYSYIDTSESTPASIVSSADGKILASTHYLPLDEKKISSAPSSDSLIVLVGLLNARIRPDIGIWDATTGRELRRIRLNPVLNGLPMLRQLAIAPDGKFLAAELVYDNGVSCVLLWEVSTGKQIVQVKGASPTFSPDSTLLMTYKDDEFYIWNASTGKKVATATTEKRLEKQPINVTPDWQTIVSVTCYSIDKWQKKCRWAINPLYQNQQSKKVALRRPNYFDTAMKIDQPICLAVSRDGKMLAWAHGSDAVRHLDGTVHLVETTTGMERACFKGHVGNINSLCFSPDGRQLASGSDDTTVLVWDVTGGWLDDRGQWRFARFSDQQVQQLWGDLANMDAARASRAIWALAGVPKQSVSFLAKHLSPIPIDQALPQRIAQLIKELDHEKYPVRHKAEVELAKLGEAAEDDMRKALEERPSADLRLRLKQLLRVIEQGRDNGGPTGDLLRSIRAVEILERIGTPKACRILETLNRGAPAARLTQEAQAALHRLRNE